MNGPLSAWAVQAAKELPNLDPIVLTTDREPRLELRLGKHSLWIIYHWGNGIKTAFSTLFSAVGELVQTEMVQDTRRTIIKLTSQEARYEVIVIPPTSEEPTLHWTTSITASLPLLLPFSPKDVLNFTAEWKLLTTGKIHSKQIGNRSGALFFGLSRPATGNVFYFQNLSSLNPYFEATETTGADLVGGHWPEIGFSLPPTDIKPLAAGKSYVVSDALVAFSTEKLKTDREVCIRYLKQLAQIYPSVKRADPIYHNWLETVESGLIDLATHAGCWTFADGHHYLNAYVSDYQTPPEIMVQLAVLLPLIEYIEWKGEKNNELIEKLKTGIPAFYKKDLGTVVRWLPKLEKQLDHSEEQKKPDVMDSWYLYHPLMNLARLAKRGDKAAKEILIGSIDYAIKVARHFGYQWPVFYNMETLKIIKAGNR